MPAGALAWTIHEPAACERFMNSRHGLWPPRAMKVVRLRTWRARVQVGGPNWCSELANRLTQASSGTTFCCTRSAGSTEVRFFVHATPPDARQLEEPTMERIHERCAGLDVHKDSVVASVHAPGEHGPR